MRWTPLIALVAALACAAPPTAATATACPSYAVMSFPAIHGAEDPEDYCTEVPLSEGEELRQIDDRHAAVYYSSGHFAYSIEAVAAHDAEGATVPTTLAVGGANVVTLTVHHRDGNPAAGGAPFVYPINPGTGWEGGVQTVLIPGPPDESELAQAPPAGSAEAPPRCEVPGLYGRSLKAARRALQRSHCKLGPVRGRRSRGAKVVKQYRETGMTLPVDTEVGVKLAAF